MTRTIITEIGTSVTSSPIKNPKKWLQCNSTVYKISLPIIIAIDTSSWALPSVV